MENQSPSCSWPDSPSEVVDAVVSVICRMAFDLGLWSEGAAPLLLVCEEAHRYAAADHSIGFGPTRRSISRIAKEGRKHGVFLGLVSQRPAELDATILCQCSTLFAMRMVNDRDQAILRSAVSDAAANLLDFVPSLGTGEVFAFGEGVALPARVKLNQLPAQMLPSSDASGDSLREQLTGVNEEFFAAVIKRWRGVSAKQQSGPDENSAEARELERQIEVPPRPVAAAEASRPSLLRRPLAGNMDISRAFQAPTKPARLPET